MLNLLGRRRKKKKEQIDKDALNVTIVAALKTIFDPEIPVNIYDLGLIYHIAISDEADIAIQMTLTTPGCPVAQTFPGTVENEIRNVIGVREVSIELVWDPPWSQDRMSEAAKLELGML